MKAAFWRTLMRCILEEDLRCLESQDYIPFDCFRGKSFLITGATGLLGHNIVEALVHISLRFSLDIRIVCPVRSAAKAARIFSDKVLSYSGIVFQEADMASYECKEEHIDYILHIASPTDSGYFVTHPVEMIDFTFSTTRRLLEVARSCSSAFVYFSSMEVYGTPGDDGKIAEDHITSCPDTMSARSSYSEGKRIAETLCRSCFEEYGTPVFILRLTQTFGPGVGKDDGRVFAQFARAALEEKDIVLKSRGETKRSYLYPMDMVSALLTILAKGEAGKAYNVANEDTYCSILDMAHMVAHDIAHDRIGVVFDLDDEGASKYLPTLHMNLDTSRLKALGWKPGHGLKDMFTRMIDSWEEDSSSPIR